MKIKNRIILILMILTLSALLISCNKKETNTTNAETINITVVVKDHDEEIFNKELEVPKEEKLLNILKENLTIEEENGFVTSIEGKSQNPDEQIYWLYTINGEFAEVGANEYKVQKDDKIEFNLNSIENE